MITSKCVYNSLSLNAKEIILLKSRQIYLIDDFYANNGKSI